MEKTRWESGDTYMFPLSIWQIEIWTFDGDANAAVAAAKERTLEWSTEDAGERWEWGEVAPSKSGCFCFWTTLW